MSNLVFPVLLGAAVGVKKSPVWSTITQRTASLREVRTSLASQPLYNFELPYEFLRFNLGYSELQTLMGFVNQMLGSWDSFLYSDPNDHFAYNQLIATGDGSTTSFQLIRTYGGSTQYIANVDQSNFVAGSTMWASDDRTLMWPFDSGVDDSSLMWLGGDTPGPYTIDVNGIITFTHAPPFGYPIYWSGPFYYRCRFMNDENEFDQELPDFHWSMSGLQFVGSLGTKI